MLKLMGLTFLVGVAMSAATAVSAGVFLVSGGIAMCEVETPEVAFTVPVPTHLVDAALLTVRVALPDEERAEIRRELEPWAPMIEAAARELAAVPNGTVLVSVRTSEETVEVTRRGGRFRVDVDTPDADVHVSVPARSFARIARQLTASL